jgi:iron complex transport system substrate-binding protein
LISSATEILYLLGLGDRVVGVSHECDYPPEVAAKPRLTRSLVDSDAASGAIDHQVRTMAAGQSALYAIDVDRLAELAPDLIVTQAQCDVCAVRYDDVVAAVRDTPALRQAEVLALNPRSILDVLDDIERVGNAVHDERVAMNATLQKASYLLFLLGMQIKAAELARDDRPRVICLEWIDPPMVAANWMPELITLAGGDPGLSERGAHSSYADWQKIVDYDPQVIVIMPCGFGLERAIVESRALAARPGWSGLSAVREGRVYAVDGNAYFNRSGPRLIDSLQILGHLVHPKHFGPPPTVDAAGAWRRMETRGDELVAAEVMPAPGGD